MMAEQGFSVYGLIWGNLREKKFQAQVQVNWSSIFYIPTGHCVSSSNLYRALSQNSVCAYFVGKSEYRILCQKVGA